MLPKDIYNEYKEFFDVKTWYELLGFNTGIWLNSISAVKTFLHEKNELVVDMDGYDKLCTKYKELPPYPLEFFRIQKFQSIKADFNTNNENDDLVI